MNLSRCLDCRWLLTGSAFILIAVGCGEGKPQPVPVAGQVTLSGGPWPKPGKMTFFPVEPAAGFPRTLGVAEFTPDGRFVAQSRQPGDGLMPGRYQVGVECWEEPPTDIRPAGKNPYVAEKHRNPKTSGLELVVPIEGMLDAKLDVPR
jgi:hypothetical protein